MKLLTHTLPCITQMTKLGSSISNSKTSGHIVESLTLEVAGVQSKYGGGEKRFYLIQAWPCTNSTVSLTLTVLSTYHIKIIDFIENAVASLLTQGHKAP